MLRSAPSQFPVFLSTPSARRATYERRLRDVLVSISIHALREEGDCLNHICVVVVFLISIHALREEGDRPGPAPRSTFAPISIHALREEGDSKNRDKISIFL